MPRIKDQRMWHPDSVQQAASWWWWGGGRSVRKKEEDGEESQSARERKRGCFCGCRDNSLCLPAAWGTRATNVTQTKTRGTSVHRCVHAAMEQESDSGALQEEGYKHSGTASTQTCTMEAEGLWLVPFTVNTDGRMGK